MDWTAARSSESSPASDLASIYPTQALGRFLFQLKGIDRKIITQWDGVRRCAVGGANRRLGVASELQQVCAEEGGMKGKVRLQQRVTAETGAGDFAPPDPG